MKGETPPAGKGPSSAPPPEKAPSSGTGPSSAAGTEEAAAGKDAKWRVDDFFNSDTRKIPPGLRDTLRKQIQDAVDANARARVHVLSDSHGR